ncbi:MAG: hypothetical protein A2076_11215 [Geobacteraceae bacterium GWC2_53_11]|nr:MAG: hypothetical protein A2076_11215 [Geobacteraceae bacterium GWC2_53_11]
MKRQCVGLLTGIIAAAFLSACGGGGGGGGGTPAPAPSAKKSSTVSGTVALVSLSSLVAKRTQKVSVRKAAGQDAAQVSIRSYDKNNVSLGVYNLTTGTTGSFAQDIALSDTGGYVVITATKPGYADFSKRIDYDKPSALNLRAELAQAATGAGTPDAANANLIEIGVVRNTVTGSKSVYSGSALKAARKSITTGANEIVELDMKIDTTALPAGTNKVIGQFQTFNSTDPTQAQYFPGAYRGKETATSAPGQLVSMAFDYIDLTTNQGKNVFKEIKKLAKAGKTRKAASIVNKVTRWVPESSCENLFLQDGDTTTPGQWDVPIWSVDPYAGDGTWLKIGDGVVSTSNGTSYTPVAISSSFTKDQAKAACKAGNYYVDITVTNPAYLEKWWNLDHIILSSAEPKEVCITGTIKDNGNIPLTDLWLYMYDEDYDYATDGTATLRTSEDGAQTFDYGYGVTDATGKFTLKAALFNNADTDRSATISYYDPISYDYKEQTVTLGLFDSVKNTCPATTTISVTRPAVCTVSGTLSGASSTGELVTFYNGGSDYYYNYTYADTGGNFAAEVPCGRELEVYLGYDWTSSAIFNVNGVTTDHPDFEASDNGAVAGSKVTLKSITKANTPPEAWGWLDSYYVTTTTPTVLASVYAYDYEANYPLSYTISYTNATGKPVELKSGTITKADAESGNTIDIPLTIPASAGSYSLNIVATDSTGKTSAESPLGSVLVYDGSSNGGFAPSVWLYADQYVINTSQLGTTPAFSLPLYAYASDLDGASTLSYSWNVKYNGVTIPNAVGTSGTILTFNPAVDVYNWSSDAYATATFTPPATVNSKTVGDGGVFTIEVTVSDNSTTPNTATYFIDLRVGTVVTYPGTITIQKPALFKKR